MNNAKKKKKKRNADQGKKNINETKKISETKSERKKIETEAKNNEKKV